MKANNQYRFFRNERRRLQFFRSIASAILVFVLIHPAFSQGKIEQITDKVIHSGKFSMVGEFLDYLEILTGGTSVKVQDLFEGEKLYASIGDLVQIPVRIEYQHEITWYGRDEWVFFEYSVLLDGAEVAWGRIPEQGYFKDQDVGRVLRKDLWIGLDQWKCGEENKRTITVFGNVYDDAPYAGLSETFGGKNDKKDPGSSTRMHKATWGNQSDRKFHDTRILAEDSKSLDLIILNPFYGTKPTAIKNKMEHGEQIGALYLERELHWKPFVQSGKGVFSPNGCDVQIEPLESLPPEWLWEMNLPNPSPLHRGSEITVRYNGHHVVPDHYGTTVDYWGLNSYVAIGKFNIPPVSKEYKDLLTSYWNEQSWSTIFLYGGITQSNQCFPAEYKAYCKQDRSSSPATAPGANAKGDTALANRYKGAPVITPSGDDRAHKEPKSQGGTKDPLEEWEKRGLTDPPGAWPLPDSLKTDAAVREGAKPPDQASPVEEWEKHGWTDPPGSWPDLKNPGGIMKDTLKGADTKKYVGVQKSLIIPRFALENDIITGTVILDSREAKEANVLLFDVNPKLVTGLVTVDDEPVIHAGEPTVSQSGKNAWLGWMAAVGGSASAVKILSKDRHNPAGSVDVFPRTDVAYPFPADVQDAEMASHLSRIWADNAGGDPGEIPPVLQYAPAVIDPGGTATFYGFFPHRKFRDEQVSSENPYELAGIGLGPVDSYLADRREITALLTLASSSIEYRALVPPNIPQERFRVYVLLGNGEVLPTEHITTVVDFITEGTPVLSTRSRGQLTIRLKAPENAGLEKQPVYLSVENLTPDIIMLDNGQSQTIRMNGEPGTSLVVPFTANRIGEYGVSLGIKEPGSMITNEQAEWLISNRFDSGMMGQFLSGFE